MEQFNIPISSIRQYCFCPRIPFFQLFREIQPIGPMWLQQGLNHHVRIAMLSKRRNLSRFDLTCKNFRFFENVSLYNDQLGMHGICDGVIYTKDEIIPLEFKISEYAPTIGAKLQLVAYAMLFKEKEKIPVQRGFILYGKKGKTLEVTINSNMEQQVLSIMNEIRNFGNKSILPSTPASEPQCAQCEYLNFCADRL